MLATDLGLALPLLALPTNRDRVAERGALCLGQAAAHGRGSRWRCGSGRRRAAPARAQECGPRSRARSGWPTAASCGSAPARRVPARLVEFLEAVEAVTRGAHHLAGLAPRCRAAWPAPAGRAWRG